MKKSLLLLSSTVLLMSNLFGTVYSDGTNPEDWKLYTATQGEVGENDGAIEFKGNGKQGFYLPLNIKCDTDNNEYRLSWKMKSKRYSQTLIQIMTKDGIRYLSYYPTENTHGKSGRFLKFGLDNKYKHIAPVRRTRDGKWHTNTQNIVRDLKRYEPNNKLVEIKAMLVRGTVLIDDVEVLTHTFTDKDKFRKLIGEKNLSDGSEVLYFSELGFGISHINNLTYDLTFFYAFSDENKNSLTALNINPIEDPFRIEVRPLANKQMLVIRACKHTPQETCSDNTFTDKYYDIYDVSDPLHAILLSSTLKKGKL